MSQVEGWDLTRKSSYWRLKAQGCSLKEIAFELALRKKEVLGTDRDRYTFSVKIWPTESKELNSWDTHSTKSGGWSWGWGWGFLENLFPSLCWVSHPQSSGAGKTDAQPLSALTTENPVQAPHFFRSIYVPLPFIRCLRWPHTVPSALCPPETYREA